MQRLWSQKLAHPQELQSFNTALGHGWRTGLMQYTYDKKYQASEIIAAEAIEKEVIVIFHHKHKHFQNELFFEKCIQDNEPLPTIASSSRAKPHYKKNGLLKYQNFSKAKKN